MSIDLGVKIASAKHLLETEVQALSEEELEKYKWHLEITQDLVRYNVSICLGRKDTSSRILLEAHQSIMAIQSKLQEIEKIIDNYSFSEKFFKKTMGSYELLNGQIQWCLWLNQENYIEAIKVQPILERIENVKKFRWQRKKKATQQSASMSYCYTGIRHIDSDSIIVPRVSSERRDYIPIGFLNKDVIVKDSAYAIYDAEPYLFGIITSKMHMIWVKTVAGRLKSDYRYSSNLCYNTFPFPNI